MTPGVDHFGMFPGPRSAGATSRRLRSDDAAIALKVAWGGPLSGRMWDPVAHFLAWKLFRLERPGREDMEPECQPVFAKISKIGSPFMILDCATTGNNSKEPRGPLLVNRISSTVQSDPLKPQKTVHLHFGQAAADWHLMSALVFTAPSTMRSLI